MSDLTHERSSYFCRSWSMLTRDEGWIKPILLLSVAIFVPFIGWFGVLGYGVEWARLTAWNVDAAPKQKNVDIGACIKSGARAFAVFVTYEAAFVIVSTISAGLFLSLIRNGVFQIIFILTHGFFTTVVLVAALHAAIYQKISAAYVVKRIYSMVCSDVRGLVRITAIGMICCIGILGIMAFFYSPAVAYYLQVMMFSFSMRYVPFDAMYSFGPVVWMGDWSLCIYVSAAILVVVGFLVVVNALGLWMRQFDVASWGSPSSVIEGLQSKSPEADESPAEASSSGVAPVCAVACSAAGSAVSAASSAVSCACAGGADTGDAVSCTAGPVADDEADATSVVSCAVGTVAAEADATSVISSAADTAVCDSNDTGVISCAADTAVCAKTAGDGEDGSEACGSTCTCAASEHHGSNDLTGDTPTESSSTKSSESTTGYETGDSAE